MCSLEACAPRPGRQDARSSAWAQWGELARAVRARRPRFGEADQGTAQAFVNFGRHLLSDESFCKLCRSHFRDPGGLKEELRNLEADLRRARTETGGDPKLERAICVLWLSRFHAHVTRHAIHASHSSVAWAQAWEPLEHESLYSLAELYDDEDLLPWLQAKHPTI